MTNDTISLWGEKRYHSLDYYLKNTYHEKVYRIALNAGRVKKAPFFPLM
jgi:radical SAM superfamily enzyme